MKFFFFPKVLSKNFFFKKILSSKTFSFVQFCFYWLGILKINLFSVYIDFFKSSIFLGLRWKAWSRFPTSKSVQFYFYLSNQFMHIWSERYFVTTCNRTEMLPWYVTAVLPRYRTTLIPYCLAAILPYHTTMMLHSYNVILP